jgi:hypothetical protein
MRWMLAATTALVVSGWIGAPRPSAAQGWNDEHSLMLVRQATERRARQLADSGLVDYKARAHGYLTFLGQLGEGFREPPRIVKADELLLEVYWKSPDLSKQRIVGLRDSLLLPTDISYHRDHLGIVQNNFPSIIRLGDGDEVVDVPHPLSANGLKEYDFDVGDSLGIEIPGRTITVDVVRVRPKDDTKPRVVGAVFVERETAQVVRMAFSFTSAAFRDKNLEDISVVLESSLVDGRFWLPSRQEIEIRRTGTVMDFPARGIIRGRWEICCYEVNTGLPMSLFAGPEIVLSAPRAQLNKGFVGRILDSLPSDVRAVTDEDVRRVQEEARSLVRQKALETRRDASLSARGISDIVRVNRVEGLAIGGAAARRMGRGVVATVGGRYGVDDKRAKGAVSLGWRRASGSGAEVFALDDFREARDEPEASLARNSIASQEFGSDYTQPFGVTGAGARLTWAPRQSLVWRVSGAYERQRPLAVHATPATGRYEPTIAARRQQGARVTLSLEHPTTLGWLGFETSGRGEIRFTSMLTPAVAAVLGAPSYDTRRQVVRGSAGLNAERPLGATRLVLHTTVAAAFSADRLSAQDLVYLGGPTTAPGYESDAFVAELGASQRIELRLPVPFFAVRMGRFGRAPGEATLAPYVHAVGVDRVSRSPFGRDGVFPAVGVGLLAPFDMLRVDVARGLRDGRWTFSIDVAREFWSVL